MANFNAFASVLGPAVAEAGKAYTDALVELPKYRDEQDELAAKRALRPLKLEEAQLELEKLRQDVRYPAPKVTRQGLYEWNPQTKKWELDVVAQPPKTFAEQAKMRQIAEDLKSPDPNVRRVAEAELKKLEAPSLNVDSLRDYRERQNDVKEALLPYQQAQLQARTQLATQQLQYMQQRGDMLARQQEHLQFLEDQARDKDELARRHYELRRQQVEAQIADNHEKMNVLYQRLDIDMQRAAGAMERQSYLPVPGAPPVHNPNAPRFTPPAQRPQRDTRSGPTNQAPIPTSVATVSPERQKEDAAITALVDEAEKTRDATKLDAAVIAFEKKWGALPSAVVVRQDKSSSVKSTTPAPQAPIERQPLPASTQTPQTQRLRQSAFNASRRYIDEYDALDRSGNLVQEVLPLITPGNVGWRGAAKNTIQNLLASLKTGTPEEQRQKEGQLEGILKAQDPAIEGKVRNAQQAMQQVVMDAKSRGERGEDRLFEANTKDPLFDPKLPILRVLSSVLAYTHALNIKNGAGGSGGRGVTQFDIQEAHKLFDPTRWFTSAPELKAALAGLQTYIQEQRGHVVNRIQEQLGSPEYWQEFAARRGGIQAVGPWKGSAATPSMAPTTSAAQPKEVASPAPAESASPASSKVATSAQIKATHAGFQKKFGEQWTMQQTLDAFRKNGYTLPASENTP